MSRLDALRALKKGVEDGRWDVDAARAVFGTTKQPYYNAHCAFRDDLNAARALHDAVRPGWEFCVYRAGAFITHPDAPGFIYAETAKPFQFCAECPGKPARALLLADIASLIDEEEEGK